MPQSAHPYNQSNPLRGYASAKVNLFLEVTGKRPDDFHNIDSVFAEISLADQIMMSWQNNGKITLETTGMDGNPEDNLVYKAVVALQKYCGISEGLHIQLQKNIPAGGGLGGGSSDAALALRMANDCWNTKVDNQTLEQIGAQFGSDVPFFFHGGVCVCQGRGEMITPIIPAIRADAASTKDSVPGFGVVVVLTGVHCETARAFRGLELPGPADVKSSKEFVDVLLNGNCDELSRVAFNRFESTIFKSYPQLGRLQKELSEFVNRPVRLSGSGGSLWFFSSRGENIGDDSGLMSWAAENNVKLLPCRINGCW